MQTPGGGSSSENRWTQFECFVDYWRILSLILTIKRLLVRFLNLELLKEIENYRKLGFNHVIDIIERPEIEMVITVIYSGGEVRFAPFQVVTQRPLEFGANTFYQRHPSSEAPPHSYRNPGFQRSVLCIYLCVAITTQYRLNTWRKFSP